MLYQNKGNHKKMKTTLSALALAMVATTAVAHDSQVAHICDIDPAEVREYPGYAGTQGVWYDRGEYFFLFSEERFLEPISYKHWSKVEAITTHARMYKEDCRLTNIEVVHTESKEPIEVVEAPVVTTPPASGPTIDPNSLYYVQNGNGYISVHYNGSTQVFAESQAEVASNWWATHINALNTASANNGVANVTMSDGVTPTSVDYTNTSDQQWWDTYLIVRHPV